jgi:3-oxoacyl-[acyl-carrier protein] reductase
MGNFSGKVAIVVGGALGIGFAAARKLLQESASVIVCSDQEDQAEQAVARLLREEGLEVKGLKADATSSADMERLVDFTVETYGVWTYSSTAPVSNAMEPW